MQSLKSTFVAVVLLGLSFGLYQLSETPVQSVDESLIPVMDISEGLDQLVASGIDHVKPRLSDGSQTMLPPQLPILPQPLAKPGLPVTTANKSNVFGSGSFSASTEMPELGKQPRVPTPGNGNVQSFAYPELDGAAVAKDSTAALRDNQSTSAPVSERQVIDNPADEDLIAALRQQMASQQTAPASQPEPPAATAVTPNNNQYSFASTAQPIASADSSMTQLAGSQQLSLSGIDSDVRLAGSEPDLASISITAAWPQVDKLVAEERYRDALQLLSRFYFSDKAVGPQRQRLLGWLDALAGKVIFSAEHHLQPQPYLVQPSESLVDIAARWKIPAQLVYNINRNEVPNPASLAPGTPLKVIDRPFDAQVDLKSNVMTLFLDDLYAGRYPVRIGISGDPKPGEYQLMAKSEAGFQWRDASGKDYPPEAPENGYGPHWMGLSGSLCIHAVKDGATDGHHGCIGLSRKDAADVFNILSNASTVTIMR